MAHAEQAPPEGTSRTQPPRTEGASCPVKLTGDGLTRLVWRPQGAAGRNGRSPSVLQKRGREENVAPALKTALGSWKQPLAVSQSPGECGRRARRALSRLLPDALRHQEAQWPRGRDWKQAHFHQDTPQPQLTVGCGHRRANLREKLGETGWQERFAGGLATPELSLAGRARRGTGPRPPEEQRGRGDVGGLALVVSASCLHFLRV